MVKKILFWLMFLLIIFLVSCQEKLEEDKIIKKEVEVKKMKLSSSAFEEGGKIPSKYTCDGDDVSPDLKLEDIPAEAKSLVLIMDDPDAPMGTWDHWVVFNIAPTTVEIREGTEPEGVGGKNSWGRTGYGGPCPPSGEHRYFFKLYALDIELDLAEGVTKQEVEKAMEGHILAEAKLMGRYERG